MAYLQKTFSKCLKCSEYIEYIKLKKLFIYMLTKKKMNQLESRTQDHRIQIQTLLSLLYTSKVMNITADHKTYN